MNGYTGQLIGPFEANQELYDEIIDQSIGEVDYISHIGVQTDIGTTVYINEEEREIGKTGIYEIGNTEITSIYFDTNVDNNTIIDYTIILKDSEN